MNQPAGFPEGVDFHTDLPVGEILRRTRTYYGHTLEEVGSVLRIRPIQLEAIETGNLEQLPGRVYAIGFVRSYSEYLGLDGEKMVMLFKTQSVGGKARPELQFPVPPSESPVPQASYVIAGVVMLILLVVGWALFFAPRETPDVIPPVPDTLQESTINDAPSMIESPPPAPVPVVNEPAVDETQIVLEIVQSSWVEIKNKDGASILRQVLKPGDKYIVPPEDGLTLSTGNAGGIKVLIGEADAVPLGKVAEVKRNVPLAAKTLLKP